MHYTVVRYSEMNYRGFFKVDESSLPAAGQFCLVKSPRGTELGTALCEPLEHEGEVLWLKGSRNQNGMKDAGNGDVLKLSGEIIRIATPEDIEKVNGQRRRGTDTEMEFCNERIKAHNLKMKLAGVEHLFEGEKIIFYFLAEGRVDFRALVRDLAKMYRTRIEMKQIGVRDEARLLAEYEHCGRPLCCKHFLNHLEPVTMKMAKSQKTTLDPSKISGRCGRLMCCLRYEDNVYQDLKRSLPRKGARIRLDKVNARVLSQDILLQKLVVELESGERVLIHISDIQEILPPTPPQKRPADSKERRKPDRRNRNGR